MSTCPNCNKPVDTLRSRHVSVRDGKIVAYCSPECLAAAATQPVRAPTPRPAPAADSGPVIQILHEPASGVVTSAPDQRKSAPVEVQPSAEVAAAESDKPKTKAERKAAEKAERERRARQLSDALKPVPKPADVAAAAAPVAKAAEPKPAAIAEEAKAVSAAALASAEAPSKKRRNRRDSSDAKGAWEWLDEEPAEPVSPRRGRDAAADDDTSPRPRSRALQVVLVLAILAILGVGGFFAYDRYLKKRADAPPPADAAALPRSTDVVAIDAGPPPPDPAQIKERALESALAVLRKTLETSTPQMQEMAALALSRAKDEQAIAFLADALPRSNTDTKRLEIAYALARAGDQRGRDALLAATKVASRDTRLDAGRKLAQLGDQAAIAPLSPFIDTRFEVAKALAMIGEPRALKELERLRKEGKKGDVKMRATIALVAAGKREYVAEVRPLVAKDSTSDFRHDASLALAERKDAAAWEMLVMNLSSTPLPEVVRALRLVAPGELTPQIEQFEQRLASLKDSEQIKAAETILMLAGPEEWVARP